MDSESMIRRELRFLRGAVIGLGTLVCFLCVGAFNWKAAPAVYKELTVQRLNVVESDGTTRMVISNKSLAPGYSDKGKKITERKIAGMIFYNDEGREDGGLIFDGARNPDGSHTAGGSLTFDEYGSDQVVALQYSDQDGKQRNGLTVTEYPPNVDPDHLWTLRREAINKMPAGAAKDSAQRVLYSVLPWRTRAFFGKDFDGSSVLRLSGKDGHPRVRLLVDSNDVARLEFLDSKGNVVSRLPQ